MTKNILRAKLETIRNILPVNEIMARNSSEATEIAKYYRKNRLAYRVFNSHDGFVHMGISDFDSFSKADFYTQAKLINQSIVSHNATKVLELAPGKAATTRYLANNNPKVTFFGIDLPNGQFKAKSQLKNIHLIYGDYHDLSKYADSSMDIVYVIEALCHAKEKNKVVAEVSRVLKKHGLFIVIDGYFSKDAFGLDQDEQTAVKLVASSMMVTSNKQDYKYFAKILHSNKLQIVTDIDYSKNIMPSLYRLEATASRFMRWPKLAKLITYIMGDIVTANSAAGYLMPYCVENNLFEYHYTLARKK